MERGELKRLRRKTRIKGEVSRPQVLQGARKLLNTEAGERNNVIVKIRKSEDASRI